MMVMKAVTQLQQKEAMSVATEPRSQTCKGAAVARWQSSVDQLSKEMTDQTMTGMRMRMKQMKAGWKRR
jgi:uncharacterized protein YukE